MNLFFFKLLTIIDYATTATNRPTITELQTWPTMNRPTLMQTYGTAAY